MDEKDIWKHNVWKTNQRKWKKINERGDKVAMVYKYEVLCYVLCCKTNRLKVKCDAVVDIYVYILSNQNTN